jgi:hypothetical protein
MIARPTREEVKAMPAGPEVDRLAAQLVLRWDVEFRDPRARGGRVHYYDPTDNVARLPEQWRPSENVFDAFVLLTHLPPAKYGLDRWYWELAKTPMDYRCSLWRADGDEWRLPDGGPSAEGRADTLPLAVCRAALMVALEW